MPRNPERDQQLREQRKKLLLDSALQVIAKRGIGLTSIQDIAKAAGLSVGNVYTYFSSKDELFSELLRRAQTEYGISVTLLAELDEDPLLKLRRMCAEWLALETNWAFTIILQTVRTNEMVPADIRQAVTDRFTANLEPVADIMRQGQRSGQILNGDPLQLALYFVSLIQGLTLQQAPGYVIPVPVNPDDIVRLFEAKNTHAKNI
ncbi:TetR/AcrR family transcriptional regulator [Paenibacillus filicis]|uniref:TetR/AcrR family transcriptional regulator n=1 Tax=Paenibacillus filicis TaxID=669464 RepID=A0ABU9DDR6_9BACL